jgi:hypothetical protein
MGITVPDPMQMGQSITRLVLALDEAYTLSSLEPR